MGSDPFFLDRIRRDGPLTVAAFMELALYHPEHGYYATRAQRSGRTGDFYTSVDAGPLFGEMLAIQIARLARAMGTDDRADCDLLEAGAGNGRLMRDVLDTLAAEFPDEYARLRVSLVELSGASRAMHAATLGPHWQRLAGSSAVLPERMRGIIFANELLDAFPVHVLIRHDDGLREVYVDARDDRLIECAGPLSDPALVRELEASGFDVLPGARAEIAPAVARWVRDVAARLEAGFLIVIDYGDEAKALRGPDRPDGTLRAFSGHRVSSRWMDDPGRQDLTAHVDFTALDRAARDAGLELITRTEQAKFLIGLGALERLEARAAALGEVDAVRWRLAAKTLLTPGALGWTHVVSVYRKWGQTPFLPIL